MSLIVMSNALNRND